MSARAKKENRLVKAGYKTKKGVFSLKKKKDDRDVDLEDEDNCGADRKKLTNYGRRQGLCLMK
jgi:hypothetical protein